MTKHTGLLIIILGISLLGCTPTTNNQVVRPTDSTSDVAIANLRLGTAYMERGDYDNALGKLEKSLAADPNYYATLNVMGVLHQRMGLAADAESYFRRALSFYPNESSTLNNYGQFLCSQGRYEEAETSFIKAADNPLYETPEYAYTNAGTCAMKNGNTESAREYYRKALDRNPNIATALIQMSDLSYQDANYLSARGYLQRYTAISPHTAKSLWLGIQIETALENQDAVSSYSLLLKNNFPDTKETQLLLESGYR